jgi:hypothetical protein
MICINKIKESQLKYLCTQFISGLIMENIFSAPAQMETVTVPCPDDIPQDVLTPSMQTAWAPPGDQPTPVVIVNPTDM